MPSWPGEGTRGGFRLHPRKPSSAPRKGMQSCLTGGRGSAGASHRGQCPQCSVTGLVQGGLAGCRLAKAKPVDTVVADGRAVGRRVHLLGGLEGAGTVALLGMRRSKSGCVGKIEARPSPNCLNMASPSAANWHPTAHVSGSRASFGNSVPQESPRSLPPAGCARRAVLT